MTFIDFVNRPSGWLPSFDIVRPKGVSYCLKWSHCNCVIIIIACTQIECIATLRAPNAMWLENHFLEKCRSMRCGRSARNPQINGHTNCEFQHTRRTETYPRFLLFLLFFCFFLCQFRFIG